MRGEQDGRMTPQERSAVLRLMAAWLEAQGARLRMFAAAELAAESFNQLAAAMLAGDHADLANHPDLAELDLQLNGFYGNDPRP